ncbi:uncharacterized protein LOC129614698 isoform X3 [Condylostylus longicornis]|uniref:uncharacterized protein LOC129614698 isoform X3 n=1 Tax=Condylostylus longicornis TaxID=2530218 RepID=UPI00244E0D77|nr:uncharacterized protein LOC129614698 isoform X3 [Condylostylus longicornis]
MLKHRFNKSKSQNSRLNNCPQGSNNSITELIDIGGLFSPPASSTTATTPNSTKNYQLSPTHIISSTSVSTTALSNPINACLATSQRWSSSSSSCGGGIGFSTSNYRQHKSDDDEDEENDTFKLFARIARTGGGSFSTSTFCGKNKSSTTKTSSPSSSKSAYMFGHNSIAAILTSPAKVKQSFRLTRRRTSSSPANPAVVAAMAAEASIPDVKSSIIGAAEGLTSKVSNSLSAATATATTKTTSSSPKSKSNATSAGSQEIIRRWNSFHSTRGECHPNRFRRNRKSTAPHIDTTYITNKLTNLNLYRNQSPSPLRSRDNYDNINCNIRSLSSPSTSTTLLQSSSSPSSSFNTTTTSLSSLSKMKKQSNLSILTINDDSIKTKKILQSKNNDKIKSQQQQLQKNKKSPPSTSKTTTTETGIATSTSSSSLSPIKSQLLTLYYDNKNDEHQYQQQHHGGRHSISYQSRHSITEGSKRITKNWYLKRGKSLADEKILKESKMGLNTVTSKKMQSTTPTIVETSFNSDITTTIVTPTTTISENCDNIIKDPSLLPSSSKIINKYNNSSNIDTNDYYDDNKHIDNNDDDDDDDDDSENNDEDNENKKYHNIGFKFYVPSHQIDVRNEDIYEDKINIKNEDDTSNINKQNKIRPTSILNIKNDDDADNNDDCINNIKQYIDDVDTPDADNENLPCNNTASTTVTTSITAAATTSTTNNLSLPPQYPMGFGKRNGGSCRRSSECFVLESSEMIVVEYPEISSSIPTNLINTSHFFQQQHQQQQQLNRNNCGIIKNSISGSTTSIKNQNIDGNSPSNPASSSATVSSPTAGATGGTGLPNTIISNSINNCNNINAVKKNNKQQNTGVQQQLHTSNQNSYSQSPIISPASAGSLSISSVAGILLSPVSNCSKSNLILSGSCTSTNTSETNLNSSFSGGNINLLKQQPQQHLSQFHHQQQQQQQQQQSQSSLLHQHQEKNQQKNQYLNTFSIPINSGCLSIHSNSQQHHRNSTPSILCTINNFSASSSGINQSNTINSNINFKSVNMDPHHIRHSGLPGNRPELYQKCNRGSHSSDTSSAYSGSDTMTSVHSSSLDTDEVDLSGLVESVVDSDEEDLAESMDSLNVRDAVRDCLEKDPSERTEDDIEALLELTQGLKAFTNMTLAVRKALCSVMVFAVVDKAGTMVMSDGEELDSWSVLINGHVEIEHKNGEKEELHVGDSFGILPTMDKLYHRGVMRTKCDDCQFVCITQTDYYRIQHQGEENTKRHEDENGQVVMVTELRQIGPDTAGTSSRRGHVVIRGTISRLMVQLIEENSMTDPTYVEDFLLTHRTFIENPKEVAKQLLQWFENEDTSPLHTNASGMEIRDRVSRVILLWVNNHFTDFEMDPEMMEFLETFEMGLEQKQMPGQLRLLHIACAAKARTRNVTLTRSSRDEDLNFKIIGPTERGSYGIFVSHIERKTKAEDVGLKRGDQILEVNGQSFEHVTHSRAMEILMGSTHLSITVKSNLLAFKEMLQQSDTKSPRSRSNRNRICVSDLAKLNSNDPRQTAAAVARLSTHELLSTSMTATGDQVDYCQSSFRDLSSQGNPSNSCNFVSNFLHNPTRKDSNQSSGSASNKGGFMTLGPKRRIQKALIKMNLLPKNNSSSSGQQINNPGSNCDDEDSSLLGNNNNDSKGITNSVIGSGASLPGSRSNNNSNNSSNKMNSANSNNMQTSNMRNNISENSTPSLYHCHSNPDLTSVASKSVTIVGNNDNEINQNSQTDSLANMNTNNVSLNTCIAAQQILTPQHQSGTIYYEDTRQSDYPEHVLKVYKSDQTCKYLLINKETTAHEVVMLALQEFGIHETSSNFSLCEVSVSEGGMIKQRRLPEHLQNLAERIGLSARYYLKTNGITETLVPDDLAPDLVRESVVHLLQLNANEVAIQLTFQDFAIFRQIESTEYVDDLFEIQSRYGTPMLKQFSELVNREMFWVVTEVCSEHNMVRRMKIVKQFIKIARHCKECRNFNSMFAIISGLGHAAVSRLRQTWEKLPTKYQKLFNDLQDLMDPSRNMSKYRQLVSAELLAQHPIIPFYPVVKKDLTFIHLGNDTRVENLINFEKLRMIAKEVRLLTHMCSSTYDLLTMLEFKGQPPSSAMVALNQMSVSTGPCAGSSSGNNSNSGSNVGVGSVIGGTMSGVTSLLYVGGGNATVKRRKKSAAAPNPKKMFEEAQMVRRVKAYLNNMKIMTDEDVLHNLSLECEASTGGHGGGGSIGCNSAPNTTTTVRKRHPSPTLSTTSSTSSTSEGKKGSLGGASNVGPKFGTASPQAVKKILSLSESTKTRPHQPRHPSIQLPLVNVGNLHHPFSHTSISPSPSPGSHRRMGSCSSTRNIFLNKGTTGSGNVTNNGNNSIGIVSPAGTVLVSAARGIHERSHSDTPTPLPSVDLSAESSSVTSLSNLPLRKNITLAGSVTSNDSGHGSCVQAEIHSNCSDSSSSSGLYHVASSIVHNSPSPTLQQRRHSSTHGHSIMAPPPPKGPRHPPAYSVAAQMARLHRLGRAHSHEGVTTAIQGGGNLSGVATGQGLLPPIGVATTTTTTITTTTSITTVSPPLNISSNVSTAGSILPTSNIPNTTQILSTTIQQNNGNNLLQQQQQQQQQQSQQLNLNNILPISSGYFQHYSHHHHLSNIGNDDDDEDAQVSAV